MLDAGHSREERGEDRQRPEEEGHRRRGGETERVDEAELVPEQHEGAEGDQRQLAPPDPQRSLPGERDRRKDQGGAAVADRRVGERVEAVVEDVLGDGEVERPEADRREQHQIGGRTAHEGRSLAPHIPRSRESHGREKPTHISCLCALRAGCCLPSSPAPRSASGSLFPGELVPSGSRRLRRSGIRLRG